MLLPALKPFDLCAFRSMSLRMLHEWKLLLMIADYLLNGVLYAVLSRAFPAAHNKFKQAKLPTHQARLLT